MLLAAAGAAAAGWLISTTARKRGRPSDAADGGSAALPTPEPMSVDSSVGTNGLGGLGRTPAQAGASDDTCVRVLNFPSPSPARNVRWWDQQPELSGERGSARTDRARSRTGGQQQDPPSRPDEENDPARAERKKRRLSEPRGGAVDPPDAVQDAASQPR